MKLVVGEVISITKWVHVQKSLGREKVITHRVSVAGSAGKHEKNERQFLSFRSFEAVSKYICLNS